MSELTFTPLSRNRFRCNQSGDIVGRSSIKAYYNRLFRLRYPRKPMEPIRKSPQSKSKIMVVITPRQNMASCPECGRLNTIDPRQENHTCWNCRKTFGLRVE